MFDQQWIRSRNLVLTGLAATVLISGIVSTQWGLAQDDPERQDREQVPDQTRDRDRDRPDIDRPGARPNQAPRTRDRDAPQRGRGGPQGTEEGMPEMRLVPPGGRNGLQDRQWRLGVYTYDTSTGVRITRVLPESPAWRVGLERGDQVITVDGYQIGIVNGRLYPLGEELQRHADRNGEVTLLVRNTRNGRLVNVNVELERRRRRR